MVLSGSHDPPTPEVHDTTTRSNISVTNICGLPVLLPIAMRMCTAAARRLSRPPGLREHPFAAAVAEVELKVD